MSEYTVCPVTGVVPGSALWVVSAPSDPTPFCAATTSCPSVLSSCTVPGYHPVGIRPWKLAERTDHARPDPSGRQPRDCERCRRLQLQKPARTGELPGPDSYRVVPRHRAARQHTLSLIH